MTDEIRYRSAEEILAFDDSDLLKIEIPEWKTIIPFRVMSAAELMEFQVSIKDPQKKLESWVRIFALCAVDEKTKERKFTDEMMSQLLKKNARVFSRLQIPLLRHNGILAEQQNDAKNVLSEVVIVGSPIASPPS